MYFKRLTSQSEGGGGREQRRNYQFGHCGQRCWRGGRKGRMLSAGELDGGKCWGTGLYDPRGSKTLAAAVMWAPPGSAILVPLINQCLVLVPYSPHPRYSKAKWLMYLSRAEPWVWVLSKICAEGSPHPSDHSVSGHQLKRRGGDMIASHNSLLCAFNYRNWPINLWPWHQIASISHQNS